MWPQNHGRLRSLTPSKHLLMRQRKYGWIGIINNGPFNFPKELYMVPQMDVVEGKENNYMGVWRIDDIN